GVTPIRAQSTQYPGFRVEGRHLYDRFGHEVVLVGVNKMVIWTDRDGLPAFPEIAKTGANAVRIVWLTEGKPGELDVAITNAIGHDLIPIVDCHDSTGKWSELSTCVDYWVRPDIVSMLKKHEAYLLINIANEAGSDVILSGEYRAAYELAIRRMRAAGLHVPLIIDAQGWGQNIDDLQLNGPYLIQADPDHNLMFSIHMWWPSEWRGASVDQMVVDEIAESIEMELPLIIGEFAHKAVGCVCCIPYETIIEEAAKNEIGYLPWSWGPGNSDCEEMDMTEDGTFETLHGWGREVALESPYSIRNVAVRPDWIVQATPVPTPTPVPPPASEALISLNQPVDATSAESADHGPVFAVDGDLSTRWSSAWRDDASITVDLGAVKPLERIVLEWETAYGEAYELQVSRDGEAWTTLVTIEEGDGGRDDHLVSAEARYVRMEGIERATEWGYSLWELWVFSEADVELPSAEAEYDPRPDLVVTDIHWEPEKPTVGDAVRFTATIENRGGQATHMDPPVHLAFQIGGETVAWTLIDRPLAPTMSMEVVAEHSDDDSGAWYPATPREFIVLAWIDDLGPAPFGVVDEAGENNNMMTAHGRVRSPQAAPTSTPDPSATPTEIAVERATPVPPTPTMMVTPTPVPDGAPPIPRGCVAGGLAVVLIAGIFAVLASTSRKRRGEQETQERPEG
ncbi:MAG: discoidin domain-containing protein, partial [Anaerolineae bacterium]